MQTSSRLHIACAFLLAAFLAVALARGSQPGSKGLVYAIEGKSTLRLDLYYPKMPPPSGGYPLIICLHGGAWISGDRYKDLFLQKLTNDGYALASIDYRLSDETKFPAQIN
ncbi:MAG: hypothetical protein ACREKL_14985, partial [Chthoniobacterales bacterium]